MPSSILHGAILISGRAVPENLAPMVAAFWLDLDPTPALG
jgi:hypothetical protein